MQIDLNNYEFIEKNAEIPLVLAEAEQCKYVGLDTENSGGLDILNPEVRLLLVQLEIKGKAYLNILRLFKKSKEHEKYLDLGNTFYDSVIKSVGELKGSFALLALYAGEPDKIIAVRKDSPLVIGVGEGENFIASDVPAFLKHSRKALFLKNHDVAVITKDAISIYNLETCREDYCRTNSCFCALTQSHWNRWSSDSNYRQVNIGFNVYDAGITLQVVEL